MNILPGFDCAGNFNAGHAGVVLQTVVGNSLTGNDTAVLSGAMYNGDLCVLTNAVGYNSNSQFATAGGAGTLPVLRKLLQQDLVALTGGIVGVNPEDYVTNASGQVSALPTWGQNPTAQPPRQLISPSSRFSVEPQTGRNRVTPYVATQANRFRARIAPWYTAAAMGANLNGQVAGIDLATGIANVAPTVATVTTPGGTSIQTGWYNYGVTYVNESGANGVLFGETAVQTISQFQITANNTKSVSIASPAALASIAGGWNVYVSGPYTTQALAIAAAQNANLTLQNTTPTAIGTAFVISTPPTSTGVSAPASNSTGLPGVTQYFINPTLIGTPGSFRLIEGDYTDPNWNATFGAGNLTPGPRYTLQFYSKYSYFDAASGTGTALVPYTS